MPTSPLDRQHVGPLLRLLVPAFPAASGFLGLVYVVTPRDRLLESPVFRVADALLPMPAWGAAFILVAAGLMVGMARRRRGTYEMSLAVLVALLVIWAAVFGASAIYDQASPGAWVWPAFAATAGIGTIRELTTARECQ